MSRRLVPSHLFPTGDTPLLPGNPSLAAQDFFTIAASIFGGLVVAPSGRCAAPDTLQHAWPPRIVTTVLQLQVAPGDSGHSVPAQMPWDARSYGLVAAIGSTEYGHPGTVAGLGYTDVEDEEQALSRRPRLGHVSPREHGEKIGAATWIAPPSSISCGGLPPIMVTTHLVGSRWLSESLEIEARAQ